MLYGALLTFRRPAELATYLETLADQTRRLDGLLVVDNDPQASGRPVLDAHLRSEANGHRLAAEAIEYLPQADNLGSAGGWALGQRHFLQGADQDDWIVLLDDDNPPTDVTMLEQLEGFAERTRHTDPRLAAVARTGAFFDPASGRISRLTQEDLHGTVRVDFVGCGHFPLYRAGLLREVGTFLDALFFGYVELEYAMRVRRFGYHFYVDGEAIRTRRVAEGRNHADSRVRSQLRTKLRPWRVYCTTRNLIYLLRASGYDQAALRVATRRGLGRPLAQVVSHPHQVPDYAKASYHGVHHGWYGRLGRTVDPTAERFQLVRQAQPVAV